MLLPPQTRLGPYEILGPLGAGGMGEVYRARDTRLEREVAVKILPAALANDAAHRQRFEHEARVVAALDHPNIVAIHDVGSTDGVFWMVSDLVQGQPLSGAALSLRRKLELAVQIAEGLAAAHRAGVIHRDLKPDNILVTGAASSHPGCVKLLDFGIAKSLSVGAGASGESTLTAPGTVMGTVNYMSPEQVSGNHLDHRSDIFSFGIVLHELLTCQAVFRRTTAVETMNAILHEDAPVLPQTIPPDVARIVLRCMEKEPKKRFESAGDLAFALQLAASPSGTSQALPAPHRQEIPIRPAALGVVLASLAVMALSVWFFRRAAPEFSWKGIMLGGSQVAMAPRVSPDGRTVAFQALVNELTQVAVMNPDSGDWSVLTHDRTRGGVNELTWSPDNSHIYFDRFPGTLEGVFRLSALGGDAQLVLEKAAYPQALADGSLLLVRLNAATQQQVFRYWPENGRLAAFSLQVTLSNGPGQIAVFPDGQEAAVWGKVIGGQGTDAANHLFLLDVATGAIRRAAPHLALDAMVGVLGVTRDGQSILAEMRAGNLYNIVAIPRNGHSPMRTLTTVATSPDLIDAGPDGSLYMDDYSRPLDVLLFPATGGVPERLVELRQAGSYHRIAVLRDARVVVSSLVGGREQLLAVEKGRDPVPVVHSSEETSTPAVALGDHEIAFLIGPVPRGTIAVASLENGTVNRKIPLGKGPIDALVASPDGATLYCAAGGAIWAVLSAGGAPKMIRKGDSVAIDPAGRRLVVEALEGGQPRLIEVPLNGTPEKPMTLLAPLELPIWGLAPEAVGKDGRILLPATSRDSWFWHPAAVDSATGKLTSIPVDYHGDFHWLGWSPDGRVVAAAEGVRSSIWRYRPAM